MLPFRNILFPVDFSEPCQAIAPRVREMRERFDAELTLVHAVDAAPLVLGSMEASIVMPLPDYAEIRKRQRQRLTDFAWEMFPLVKPVLLLEDGEAGAVISHVIKRQGADLVMLPTRGHGALRRFLLGSVAAKVLHDADCAVWTGVHPEETEPAAAYRHILCALSLDTEESPAILRAASFLAKNYGAELRLLHAADLPVAGWDVDLAPYRKGILDAIDQKIRHLRQETGIDAPYEIVEGRMPDQVRRVAEERKADLIVTGRGHAQDGIGRAWSQLYSIVREAPCPVLSI